jgi:predicted lipoprotein with Yx(FWY)xxD motif
MEAPWSGGEERSVCHHDSVAVGSRATHRDEPQVGIGAIRQQPFQGSRDAVNACRKQPCWDMLRRTSLPLLGALPFALLALAGCGGSASHAAPTTSDGRPASVGVANTGLGDVLVNRQGRTLYLFARDSGTTSACTGACAVNWPPLHVRGAPVVGDGAKPSELGKTARADGISQLTYNGHPLYTFVNDKKPGDTNGEGINAFGGAWFAVSPAGAKVAPRSPNSGGGYGGGY